MAHSPALPVAAAGGRRSAARSTGVLLLLLCALLPGASPASAVGSVDLWVDLPQLTPASPMVGQEVTIALTIHTNGTAAIENLTLRWGVGVLTNTVALVNLGLSANTPVTVEFPWQSDSVVPGTVILVFAIGFPPVGSAANPTNLTDGTPADAQASVAVSVAPLPTFDPADLTVGPLFLGNDQPAIDSVLEVDLRLS